MNIAYCAGMARREGCSMLFLPECFGYMGESATQTLEQAEPPIRQPSPLDGSEHDTRLAYALETIFANGVASDDGQYVRPSAVDTESTTSPVSILRALQTIAKVSQLWISAGGMHESGAPPDEESGHRRIYNTHVILDDQGCIRETYEKIHLFDVVIPGKVQLRESATTAPGRRLVVCDSPIGS